MVEEPSTSFRTLDCYAMKASKWSGARYELSSTNSIRAKIDQEQGDSGVGSI